MATHSLAKSEAVIGRFCATAQGSDPVAMAVALMQDPAIRMHGPEHHFLTAAVLLTAYCNTTGTELGDRLEKVRIRTSRISPGVCGYYGVCGDVMAVGAFISVLLGTTYLSKSEWQLTAAIAAGCLNAIATTPGPRCCKRATLATLLAAVDGVKELLAIPLTAPTAIPICEFSRLNKDCIGAACVFHRTHANHRSALMNK